MTGKQLKRLVLVGITLLVTALISSSLFGSLTEPQVNDRLQLYQTDLVLHATEISPAAGDEWGSAQQALLQENPLQAALEEYQTVQTSALENLQTMQTQLRQRQQAQPVDSSLPPSSEVLAQQRLVQQQQNFLDLLNLRIGILRAEQENVAGAIDAWTAVTTEADGLQDNKLAAETLIGLWGNPPRLLPDADRTLQKTLEGWFEFRTLSRLYRLQQRSEALAALQSQEQQMAQSALTKLAIVGVLPVLGGLVGVVLLVVMAVQWLVARSVPPLPRWEVPWDWETMLQVLMVGFFLVGQVVLPLVLSSFGMSFAAFGSRARAAYTLIYYLSMATTGLLVLFVSVKSFRPLPEGWFQLTGKRNWLLWGTGGYFAALPLMIGVSIANQQIWQGQGGSNPLLQTVLEEGDGIALGMFFFTAAIAAPIFEEIMFRGFLLPSLTKYVSVNWAVLLSALLFAIAHLSLSEVLPLTVLGIVLGFVYSRSRGLLAPMVLHSLWNSVTMIGLVILGGSN